MPRAGCRTRPALPAAVVTGDGVADRLVGSPSPADLTSALGNRALRRSSSSLRAHVLPPCQDRVVVLDVPELVVQGVLIPERHSWRGRPEHCSGRRTGTRVRETDLEQSRHRARVRPNTPGLAHRPPAAGPRLRTPARVSKALIRWAAINGMLLRRITRGRPARRQLRRTFTWT
jgi:hypothetical protein